MDDDKNFSLKDSDKVYYLKLNENGDFILSCINYTEFGEREYKNVILTKKGFQKYLENNHDVCDVLDKFVKKYFAD